jgi:glycosyltransferase involved in cell wall biosynthesis
MVELIRRLARTPCDVHVACFRAEGPWLDAARAAATSFADFPLGSLMSRRAAAQTARLGNWFRERGVQVVQACDLYANIVALPAGALARVPARVGSRRGIVSPVRGRGLLPLQRAGYALAHRVVANSAAAAARLREEFVPARRIVVIPNGIDVPPEAGRRPRDRGPVITTVANLRHGKGHHVLLRAAASVLRRHPDARFHLVGDGPLRTALELEARALGVADRVAFLGHRDDVADVLAASDVFAFPSFMEAFPNAVMEAMSLALPVVATNVGGIPELVSNRDNGRLVAAGDAAALAAALVEVIESPADAEAMGRAAAATVRERYSFERMTREFEGLYRELLHGRLSNPLPIRAA